MLLRARDIVNKTLDELWYLADVPRCTVEMDDGPLEATGRSTIYSWFYWEYHRKHPSACLLKKHHLGMEYMKKNTHTRMLSTILFDTFDSLKGSVPIAELAAIVPFITDDLYNELSVRLEEYVTSTSILDYLEVLDDPVIDNINRNLQPTRESIEDGRRKITARLKEKGVMVKNALKEINETNQLSWGQVMQTLSARAYVTDIDNYFQPAPIMRGYAHGISAAGDSLKESRSSSKSTLSNTSDIKDTEYFNRRMQLICQVIQQVVPGDCGSEEYVCLRVTGPDKGTCGNFKSLIGKYRLMEDGSLQVISSKDTDLIGTLVKIRSGGLCKHRHLYMICSTCMGEMAHSVPYKANLGYWSATAICAAITQAVLSTKHLDAAIQLLGMVMNRDKKKYLKLSEDGAGLVLLPEMQKRDMKITVKSDQINHLEDLDIIDTITDRVAARMSDIMSVSFSTSHPITGFADYTAVDMGIGKSPIHFSCEALEYIRNSRWLMTNTGDYQFDMKDFPENVPVFTLPKKHLSMPEFAASVATFIESKSDSDSSKKKDGDLKHTLSSFTGYGDALTALTDIITDKLDGVNIVHMETILLAFMVRSVEMGDGRIPYLDEPIEFAKRSELFKTRSLGAAMPFEKQEDWIFNYRSLNGAGRPDTPMDGILHPIVGDRVELKLSDPIRETVRVKEYIKQTNLKKNRKTGNISD